MLKSGRRPTPEQHYEWYLQQFEKEIGSGPSYSHELERVGKQAFGPKFDGVFAADQIPRRFSSIIANLDNSDEKGSHWIAIARAAPRKKYLVYDSFGRKTSKIIGHGVGHLETYDTEGDAEQTKAEDNCGPRSLAWLKVFFTLGPRAAAQI